MDSNTAYFDFYVKGFDNANQFAYIPEFNGNESIISYTEGFSDGKSGNKKDIDDFENWFCNLFN